MTPDGITKPVTVATYHLEDVRRFKREIPGLRNVAEWKIEELFHEYSQRPGFCASWLTVDEGRIADFSKWLDAKWEAS